MSVCTTCESRPADEGFSSCALCRKYHREKGREKRARARGLSTEQAQAEVATLGEAATGHGGRRAREPKPRFVQYSIVRTVEPPAWMLDPTLLPRKPPGARA